MTAQLSLPSHGSEGRNSWTQQATDVVLKRELHGEHSPMLLSEGSSNVQIKPF